MAAPSGTVWGSIVGNYGRIGIYTKVTSTDTQSTRLVEVWFWSKYSISDSNNTLYVNDNSASATANRGSVSINTTVDTGSGWSTSNQVKLKTYEQTFSRGTSSLKRYTAAKLEGIDRIGGTMSVSTSYTIPALKSYTIKYNANGGNGAPSEQKKYYGKSLTLSKTKPTRNGYTFKGWATSSTGSVSYASGATYTSNASVTLYAVWQINTYTIKFNANGGTGAPSSQTKTHNVAITLSSKIPTKTYVDNEGNTRSYKFKGWSTSSFALTTNYAAGAKYAKNESVTLYAVWSLLDTYNISYDTTGGSEVASQTKVNNVSIKLSTTIPTRTGYTFKGWGLSEDSTTVSYASGATYSTNADLILYAIWTPWTHTVNFNLNGGSGTVPSSFTKTNDVDAIIKESNISKEFCTFKCWSRYPDGTNNSGTGSGTANYYIGDNYDYRQNGGTVTLYAIWKENSVSISILDKSCKAVNFVENDEIIGFKNDGTVYAKEFIEDNKIILDNLNFHFSEIIEK